MNAILSMDEGNGIGNGGELLYRIPEDMKFFRKMTLGKTVVMGRRTLESLPGGKPLTNRTNIVLTRQNIKINDAVVCGDLDTLFGAVRDLNGDDLFVIGGKDIYALLMPYCRYCYLTRVHAEKAADTRLAEELFSSFREISRSPRQEYEGIAYSYITLENSKPLPIPPR